MPTRTAGAMSRGAADRSRPPHDLATRFVRSIQAGGEPAGTGAVVVAVSGGLDSVALLHLLRFGGGCDPARLHVAHFDHAMRPGSAADAAWVSGLATAWGLPLVRERSPHALASEAKAREARYDFLNRVCTELAADRLATAHHADDQVETVLFRLARGSGVAGLQGIPVRSGRWLWRPLLSFGRGEIEQYAEATGLMWREDQSNLDPRYARNVIRHRVLPDLQAHVAPGVRPALLALAEQARDDEGAWASLLPALLRSAGHEALPGSHRLDAARFAGLHSGIAGRLLRQVAQDLGVSLGRTGTRVATEFISAGLSGTAVQLGHGLLLRRELEWLVMEFESPFVPEREVTIEDAGDGAESVVVGGCSRRVHWTAGDGGMEGMWQHTVVGPRYPLTVRGRRPGDRIRMPYGSKKVKKLLLEARVSSRSRDRTPVLVDSRGDVLWIPGIATGTQNQRRAGSPVLHIGIGRADTD